MLKPSKEAKLPENLLSYSDAGIGRIDGGNRIGITRYREIYRYITNFFNILVTAQQFVTED